MLPQEVIAAVVFLGLSVSEIFERQKWCFKREKKKRDKEKFPHTPYIRNKKESGVVEKDEITTHTIYIWPLCFWIAQKSAFV